jgi:hypothetical protein
MTLVLSARVFNIDIDDDFTVAHAANSVFNDNANISAVEFRHWHRTVAAFRRGFGLVEVHGTTYQF